MNAIETLRPGDEVEWWHVSRGGYGFGHWVPAIVVRAPRTGNPGGRVRISALKANGTRAERTVHARNLRRVEAAR